MELGSGTYKRIARNALRGNWIRAAAAGLIAGWLGVFSTSLLFKIKYVLASAGMVRCLETFPVASAFFLGCAVLIAIVHFFIGGVIQLGYIDFNLALLDRRKSSISLLVRRFSYWWKMICSKIAMFFILSLGYLLLLVPGILAVYSYAMVPYILEEKPDFTVYDAFHASREIMKGHKWELFCLRLSYFGWYILSILTMGIGLIFVIPYRYAAEAAFYNEISGRADAFYGREKQE